MGILGKGEGPFLKQVGRSVVARLLRVCRLGGGRRKWVDRSGMLMRRDELFAVFPYRGSRRLGKLSKLGT